MPTSNPSPKILFVDDEQPLLDVWVKFFTKRNFQVLTASSGEEGLKVIRREKPALVVLDIRMPGMSGIDVLKELRKKDKTTKVIILTGYGTADSVRVGAEMGVSDFIAKPFDLNRLCRMIEETLGLPKT